MSPAAQQPDATLPRTAADLNGLVERARAGDSSTLPVLRRLLDIPEVVDLLGGDLAQQVEHSFVWALAGNDLAFREALSRKLGLLRVELAGPDPTPLERLLVERVVACWLQVQDADIRYAQATNLSGARLDDYQRRMDRAHRRYLAALKTLALVRKLALPVLQVNIARSQVNVASGGLVDE